MLFHRSLLLGVVLGGLALTGFGCKKIDSSRPNTTSAFANGQVKLPTISVDTKAAKPTPQKERPPEKQPHPEIVRLREVMSSFQKSQSYRAKITIGGADGIQGDISYSQANGLFGKLTLKNGLTTDMALQGNRVAIRTGTTTWQEITGTEEASNISELFTSITSQGAADPLYPSINARYVSAKEEAARDCTLHTVSQYMGNFSSYQTIQFCVANGLPRYFSVPSQDGLIEIEYRDVDKPVEVFFPLP